MTSNLSAETKKTFEDLQKPTMALIASFYEMPTEVKGIFSDVMAIYEANPTEENAKILSDTIMGRTSVEDKKAWIKENVATVSPTVRAAAKKKYIDEQQSVHNGVPTSGMMLVGLDIVSRAEKNALMEAQAAVRLISHVDVAHDYQPKTNYQNADGSFEKAFLDKPFATKMQRLEHLVDAVVNDVYTQEEESRDEFWKTRVSGEPMPSTEDYTIPSVKSFCQRNVFLQKARNEALNTLGRVAQTLEKTNPEAAKRISAMTDSLDVSKKLGVVRTLSMIEQIEDFYGKIFSSVVLYPSYPSYGEDGLKRVKKINEEISKHLDVFKESQEPLSKEDYDALKESVKDRPVAGLVEHRTRQILSMEAAEMARQQMEIKVRD